MYRMSCIPFVGVHAENNCLGSVCVRVSADRVAHVSNACNHGSCCYVTLDQVHLQWVCFTLVQQPLGCGRARRGRPGHPLCGRRLAHHAALPLPPAPAGATPRRPIYPPATFHCTSLAGAAERAGMPGNIEHGSGSEDGSDGAFGILWAVHTHKNGGGTQVGHALHGARTVGGRPQEPLAILLQGRILSSALARNPSTHCRTSWILCRGAAATWRACG